MMCCDRRADKLKEMDDVVWEHASSQLNLSSMVEPIMTEVRTRDLPSAGPAQKVEDMQSSARANTHHKSHRYFVWLSAYSRLPRWGVLHIL